MYFKLIFEIVLVYGGKNTKTRMNSRNLLTTRKGRFVAFSLMYISEGIPYGFTSIAMVTFMPGRSFA